MKKIALIVIIIIPIALFAQRKSADYDRVNIREILHMNGVTAIQPDGTLIDYINMDDPVNGTDGVNLRTLEAYRDSAQIIDIDSLYNLFQYFPSFGDSTLNSDSTFYIRPRPSCSNCWDYRYFASSVWTEWFCAENGNPNLRINENAYSILEISNWDLKFRENARYQYGIFAPPKYSVLVHRDSTFEWQNNLIIDDGITAIGEGAGYTGKSAIVLSGTVFYPNSVSTHAVQDTQWYYTYDSQPYENVILIGKEVTATTDNQAVIGDSTITQLFVHGYYSGDGFIYHDTLTDQYDTLYLNHLVLSPADTGKIAVNRGDSIVWEPKDSILLNSVWYQFNDTIVVGSLDSMYNTFTNEWTTDTITMPTAIDSIYNTFTELWTTDTIEMPIVIDSFINLEDTPDNYPAESLGQMVKNGGSNSVNFSDYIGQDSDGVWVKATDVYVYGWGSSIISNGSFTNYSISGSSPNYIVDWSSWIESYGCYYNNYDPYYAPTRVMFKDRSDPLFGCPVCDTCTNNDYSISQNVTVSIGETYKLTVSGQLSNSSQTAYIEVYLGSQLIGDTKAAYGGSSYLIFEFDATVDGVQELKFTANGTFNTSVIYLDYVSLQELTDEFVPVNGFRVVDESMNDIYYFPARDGEANQVMTTDGNGLLSFRNVIAVDTIQSLSTDTVYVSNIRVDTIFVANEPINLESDSIYSPIDTTWLSNGDTIGVGTIAVKDFWYGTQAEYDANTAKNGISPQASNTIAFILN